MAEQRGFAEKSDGNRSHQDTEKESRLVADILFRIATSAAKPGHIQHSGDNGTDKGKDARRSINNFCDKIQQVVVSQQDANGNSETGDGNPK